MPVLQKKYLYKVFRSGVFLGNLPQPLTEFGYRQQINTPAAQLTIEVPVSLDTASLSVEVLQTEQGEDIITEGGDQLTTERAPDAAGDGSSTSLIRNNNDIEVWEFSDANPNGIKVFEGFISSWEGRLGSSDTVVLTVLSYGVELDNYIIESGDSVDFTQILTTFYNGIGNSKFEERNYRLQEWTVGSGVTNLSAIELSLQALYDTTVLLEVFDNLADAQSFSSIPLATKTQSVTNNLAFEDIKFILDEPIVVEPAASYFFRFSPDWEGIEILPHTIITYEFYNPSVHAGAAYYWDLVDWELQNADLYMRTYTSAGETTAPYSSVDPSDILTDIIDDYTGRGGTVDYDGASIESTGLTVSYTFVLNTVLEGVKKVLELAPSNWYFYVDPGSSIIYLKETNATADHVLIKGRHINELNLKATVENIRNKVYFSGGDAGGGENLFTLYTDAESISNNAGRQKIQRISDNRVTLQATADAIGQSQLEQRSSEEFTAIITLPEDSFDISSLSLGDTIGFAGFGTFIDGLILQITERDYSPEALTIRVGTLPVQINRRIEELARRLDNQETVDNPTAPS